MNEKPVETSAETHHRSARERQRRGPMWGCLKALVFTFGGLLVLLLLVVGGGYYYLGTGSFAGLVKLRIEKTLEARLGRHVYIHDVQIIRSRPQRVIINDLRIANSPGAVNKYFATVRQLEILGGIDSFWGRRIRVGRVDIRDPRLYFEVYPAGAPLVHNFPQWNSGPPSKYTIYHLDIGKLFVTGGGFSFLDRKHDLAAVSSDIASEVTVTRAEDLYAGFLTSPRMTVRVQNYLPFDVDMRGGFRYTPGVLALNSIALRGRNMEVFVSGRLDPLTQGVYDLRLTSRLGLDRVREIFKVNKVLEGQLSLDTRLRGKQGTFSLTGGWVSPKISADVYDLANAKGRLNVTDRQAVIEVDSARYGGGTISAHYVLPQYSEPYPMSVDLRYNNVSLEKLFSDWGVKDTGLRGGATGQLAYHWNKDLVLAGAGTGSARLTRNSTAFSNAKYPIALGGFADFAIDDGTVKFSRAELTTDKSRIAFSGTLRIEDINTNLALRINSEDFSELDRVAFNFARSADKKDFELLGLGGSGEITGTVRGPIKTPAVVAHIASSGTKYNNVLLGNADIDLRYDGKSSTLTFDRSMFREGNGTLALTGTIRFPDRGPSPLFDLAIDASAYPIERAMSIVELPFKGIKGVGTGRLVVTGSPETGRVRFANLVVAQGSSEVRIRGDVNWAPGEGNVRFDLDVAARDFPVADLITFLDLGTFPVTGALTGTLHIEGTKADMEGAGAITVRKGTVFGEAVDVASADIVFTKGSIRATNVSVTSPAGQITGEAEVNLSTNKFSYIVKSSSIDLSKLKLLESLAGALGGNVTLTSSGGGTFEQPEVVVEATLNNATLKGLALPPGSAPPTIYLAIRNNRLIVRGSIADIVTIEGDGVVGKELAVDGNVRITVTDVARLVAMSPSTASLPASGNFVLDLKLGGRLSSLEALQIEGTFPVFNLALSDDQFTAPQPLRVSLRNGVVSFDQFTLQHPGSTFSVTGTAEITGQKRMSIAIDGSVEAALLQLFMRDLRADGHIRVTAAITGTTTSPNITGVAEMQDAQFRLPGFPQLIDNVTGTLDFGGDSIKIALKASVGGGTITAGGSIGLEGLKPQNVRLTINGREVALRYFEGITVAGDFELGLTGDLDRMILAGNVDVSRALYSRDFDFTTALLNVLTSRRTVVPVMGASWQDHVSLNVHVNANTPGTLAVRNNIATVGGTAELDVNGTLANPVVLGLITLEEGGEVRIQNIDYRVVRGTINFQNPFRIDPYFDITLEGRVSGGGFTSAELESGPIDVTINLTGTIDRFTPNITSDPPASDITLFSILGFGGLAGSGATGGSSSVGTIGASLLGQGLGLLSNRILPFADAFTIDPNLIDTQNDPGTKVTFEKRVSNDIRLLVIYNLTRSHSRVLLEWQVNPDWTLQFTNDEVRHEFRAEARFRRRYAGRWSWGGNHKPVTMVAGLGPFEGTILHPENAPEPPPVAGVAPPTGPRVQKVGYRSDAPFDTALVTQFVAIRTGQPLSIRDMQSTIKNLYATGNFRDVRIQTTPEGGGVDVTVVLSLNYRVSNIWFEGLSGADRTRAERELSVRPGDVLSLNAVDRSATSVRDFLSRAGYLEARVDPETTFERSLSSAEVVFRVATGPRATVGSVTITGDVAPFRNEDLIKEMRRGPGKTFRVGDARNDEERMERFMIRRNHRKADVRYEGYTYDAATKSVALRYTATAGPIVRVEVEGVPRSAVRRVLPFGRNQAYSEDVVETAADDMVKLYQQRGYYNVTVDTEGRLEGDTWITTYKVNPGPHFRLAAVNFTGNEKVSDKELAGIVQTSTRGGLRSLLGSLLRRPGGPTRAQLGADRDALESYYRLKGFTEATVTTPVVRQNAAAGTMSVDFPITEGPQTLVRGVSIEGNEQVRSSELPTPTVKPGDPLNPQALQADTIALQSFYANRGNAEAQISMRRDVSADKTAVDVVYTVAEGPQIKVGDVIVRGNTYTDSDVVLRKAELDKGQPFSYTSILQAQRNLYNLGIFQRVDIQPEQAGTSLADRNVVVQVEEGKNLTIAGAGGVTYQSGPGISPLGSASVAHRNLFGTGRYLGLELIGSRERKEGFLTYREPFLGRYNIPVNVSVFQSNEQRPSAQLVQRGASIELFKVARLQTRWSLRYEFRVSDCTKGPLCRQAEQAILPGVNRDITDISISSITPTFFWDRRDDPINPHRGFFTTASIQHAFKAFGAEAAFTKEYTQASYYFPVSSRSVFAVSARVGLIHAGDVIANGIRRSSVPYTERFTAGGESTHRAYNLDLLGTLCDPPNSGCANETLVRILNEETGEPTGAIAPIGGDGLFIANIEYRFPIFSSVGGAVFTDVGNVFRESTIHFNDLRWGVGTGLRYLSPVGPLRFDVGYKLRRRDYEKPFAFFLTLGYAF